MNTLDRYFVVLVLFLATGALIPLLLQQGEDTVDLVNGDPRIQAMWLGIYGGTSLLIAAQWRRFVRVTTRDKLLLLLVGLALISVLWSAAPGVTLRRDVALLGTTLFGAYLATRYELSEQLRLLAWALGVAALLSLVFALALPSYGVTIDSTGVAWQGIYAGGKNVLGRVMALSMIVFLLLALDAQRRRWILWVGVGLSAVLLVLSDSVTSQLSSLAILLFLPLYAALRWHYVFAAVFFALAVLVAGGVIIWLSANTELVLTSLGRDLTLTYRTELWPAVIEMIRQRPWLGYGYGAFWLGWAGESAHVWLWNADVKLEAIHAHNGFLELCLNIGLLGLSTFVCGFLLAVGRAVKWVHSTKTAEDLWPLAYLTFLLLYNLSESAILSHNNIFWVLYVTVVLSTATRLSAARTVNGSSISASGGNRPELAQSISQR